MRWPVIVDGGRWEAGASITFPFPSEVIEMTLTGTVLAVEDPALLSYTCLLYLGSR